MTKNLVIVESPAKAKTIEKYLGKDFHVLSSVGHIRSIVKKTTDGTPPIDVKNGFKTQYEVDPEKKKVITELKKAEEQLQAVNKELEQQRAAGQTAFSSKSPGSIDAAFGTAGHDLEALHVGLEFGYGPRRQRAEQSHGPGRQLRHPVMHPGALATGCHQAGGFHDAQMARDLGLDFLERAGQLADAKFIARQQQGQNAPPRRVGKGVEQGLGFHRDEYTRWRIYAQTDGGKSSPDSGREP